MYWSITKHDGINMFKCKIIEIRKIHLNVEEDTL